MQSSILHGKGHYIHPPSIEVGIPYRIVKNDASTRARVYDNPHVWGKSPCIQDTMDTHFWKVRILPLYHCIMVAKTAFTLHEKNPENYVFGQMAISSTFFEPPP